MKKIIVAILALLACYHLLARKTLVNHHAILSKISDAPPPCTESSINNPLTFSKIPGCQTIITGDSGAIPIHYNSIGLRDKDFGQYSKKYRILFVGDSLVVNTQVPLESTIPKLLEKKLLLKKYRVEIINAGLEGYNGEQIYIKLKQLLEHYHPNAVFFLPTNRVSFFHDILGWKYTQFNSNRTPIFYKKNPYERLPPIIATNLQNLFTAKILITFFDSYDRLVASWAMLLNSEKNPFEKSIFLLNKMNLLSKENKSSFLLLLEQAPIYNGQNASPRTYFSFMKWFDRILVPTIALPPEKLVPKLQSSKIDFLAIQSIFSPEKGQAAIARSSIHQGPQDNESTAKNILMALEPMLKKNLKK